MRVSRRHSPTLHKICLAILLGITLTWSRTAAGSPTAAQGPQPSNEHSPSQEPEILGDPPFPLESADLEEPPLPGDLIVPPGVFPFKTSFRTVDATEFAGALAGIVAAQTGAGCTASGLRAIPDEGDPSCFFLVRCISTTRGKRGCCPSGQTFAKPDEKNELGSCTLGGTDGHRCGGPSEIFAANTLLQKLVDWCLAKREVGRLLIPNPAGCVLSVWIPHLAQWITRWGL